MNRALAIGALVLAACRFDGGGVAADDQAGDDVAGDVDAEPNAPDAADDPRPDARRPDAMPIDAPPETPEGTLVAASAVGAVTLDGASGEFVAAGADFVEYAIDDGELYDAFAASYTPSSSVRFAAIHDDEAI